MHSAIRGVMAMVALPLCARSYNTPLGRIQAPQGTIPF